MKYEVITFKSVMCRVNFLRITCDDTRRTQKICLPFLIVEPMVINFPALVCLSGSGAKGKMNECFLPIYFILFSSLCPSLHFTVVLGINKFYACVMSSRLCVPLNIREYDLKKKKKNVYAVSTK